MALDLLWGFAWLASTSSVSAHTVSTRTRILFSGSTIYAGT